MLEQISLMFDYSETSLFVVSTYNPWMIILSILISIFSSFMAFQVASQAANSNTLRKHISLFIGSIALGCGVWSMHFIGMLALRLCTDISFQFIPTSISVLPAIFASWVALNLITQKKVEWIQFILGGVLVGLGIGSMHYMGMAAMEMAPLLRYDITMFCVSILVAIILAIFALWIRFGLDNTESRLSNHHKMILSSILMGAAVSAMHYIGMLAARFVLPPGMELSKQTNEISWFLAFVVGVVTVVIICLVLCITLIFKYKDISALAINNERRLLAIMDTAIDCIICIDSAGIITSVNKVVTSLLGWQAHELIGNNVKMIVPTPNHDDHEQYIHNYLKTGKAKIIGTGQEVEAMTKQGERIPVRLGIGDAKYNNEHIFVAFISDLRERKKMENELRDNESKIRSLLTNIPGVAFRCFDSPGWPTVFINDEVEKLLGYPAKDFLITENKPKRYLEDFVHHNDLERILSTDLKHSDGYQLEYRMVDKDKNIKWVMEYGRSTQIDNTNEHYLDAFIMDITQRKVMENALVSEKEKAEKAAETRTAFLANMSHEIRTPMNAIIGFSDIVLDDDLTPSQRKQVSTINQSAKSLLHILNDILDSAKLDKGKFQLEYRDFSLIEEVDSVVSTLWLSAQAKGLEIDLNIDEQLQCFYNGSPDRIRQVLTNLIGNAIKFTEVGKVTIDICERSEGSLTFTIIDTGIGIAESQLDTIFDAFAQADESMSRRFGGTGLGTTISKQLVELMGGEISVQSNNNKGSEFKFTLPLTRVDSPENLSLPEQYTKLPCLHVLIVDDIEQNIELLTLLLKRNGHKIITARNGEQALLKMASDKVDIVLMDIQMPVMDGLTAAKTRREFELTHQLPELPIIALTASVLPQDRLSAEESGMNGFANKPIDIQQLMSEIANALKFDDLVPDKVLFTPKEQLKIDIEKGVALWGTKTKLYSEIFRFVSTFTNEINQLKLTIEQKDFELLKELTHKYKGVSGNLALNSVMHMFSLLEDIASRQAYDEALPLLAKIEKVLVDINTCLLNKNTNKLNNITVALKEQKDKPISELITILSALEVHVSNNEFDEVLLDELQLWQGNYQQEIHVIMNHCNNFDFELALKEIDALLYLLQSDNG